MAEEKKINNELDHANEAFYANGFTLWVDGNEATMDFRQTSPRNDVLPNGEAFLSVTHKHRAVVTSPLVAKMMLEVLKGEIAKFEKKNGEIKLPANWKLKPPPKVKVSNDEGTEGSATYIR